MFTIYRLVERALPVEFGPRQLRFQRGINTHVINNENNDELLCSSETAERSLKTLGWS
jgi:hypothetical protein